MVLYTPVLPITWKKGLKNIKVVRLVNIQDRINRKKLYFLKNSPVKLRLLKKKEKLKN